MTLFLFAEPDTLIVRLFSLVFNTLDARLVYCGRGENWEILEKLKNLKNSKNRENQFN